MKNINNWVAVVLMIALTITCYNTRKMRHLLEQSMDNQVSEYFYSSYVPDYVYESYVPEHKYETIPVFESHELYEVMDNLTIEEADQNN